MRLLPEENMKYILRAAKIAKESTCLRSKCGSVIVKDGEIIGEGYNSPAGSVRRCSCDKDSLHKKVTDKTCCVHAEQRAIFDALSNNSDKIKGSILYFIRLNSNGEISFAGRPYCTICSKSALDVGIEEFVLLHENGLTAYGTEEYNRISYEFNGK